jgi:starch synthase
MTVAQILRKYDPSEWGGTETAVLQLSADLATKGVRSVTFAPALGKPAGGPDPFAAAGCPVRRFRASVPVWGITREHRMQMVAVGGNLVSMELLRDLWREPKVDVVHSHAQGRIGAIGRAVAGARGAPFVLSIHGGAYDLPDRVRSELLAPGAGGFDWGRAVGLALRARRLVALADAVITLNPREATLIRERHPGRRILVERHGISTSLFARECRAAATAAFPRVEGRTVLLVLGRIDPTKNQSWLLAEVAEIARRHPKALLVFVGSITNREYGDAFHERIRASGLEDSVLVAGSLPFGDPRLVGLLQLARAMALPSLSETFGLVILEAWAAGTPVISSRTSGASALISDGVNGLLFDLDNPAGFHGAVDLVMARPDFASAMGAAGRAEAVEKYDTSARAEKMKQLYQELIEEKHAPRRN